jgi:hypothetical protein
LDRLLISPDGDSATVSGLALSSNDDEASKPPKLGLSSVDLAVELPKTLSRRFLRRASVRSSSKLGEGDWWWWWPDDVVVVLPGWDGPPWCLGNPSISIRLFLRLSEVLSPEADAPPADKTAVGGAEVGSPHDFVGLGGYFCFVGDGGSLTSAWKEEIRFMRKKEPWTMDIKMVDFSLSAHFAETLSPISLQLCTGILT